MVTSLSPGRAIVMYGRSLMALEIAHSLGQRGVEVIGCDDVDFTVLSFSRYVDRSFVHASHRKDPDKFIEDLERNILKHKPKDDRPYVLIPVFRETDIVAEHAARLAPHITVAAPDYESITKVFPKDRLVETAARLGLHAPGSIVPRSESDLVNAPLPAILKPADDVGGRGVRRIETLEALAGAYRDNLDRYGVPPVVQDLVPGKDYCLTVICERGDVKASMAYRNLRKFPAQSGAGIVRETVEDSRFLEVARPLLMDANWHGVAEIDFVWDEKPRSEPWLIEVNARFWAGLFQSVESGVDFPWLLYRLAVDGRVPETGPAKVGQKTKVPTVWLLSAIQDILRNEPERERMERSWEDVLAHIQNKGIREAFQDLGQRLGRRGGRMTYREAFAELQKIKTEMREAKSEFPLREDPFIIFGVMFILGSLIRHGKLPPEVKF
ncbi:MAG: ATP-grasp domain-containing protein [Alphaproteobacteria bacterium]|nr:ATP-grasp domain-containing protein [Alphaproteobacteria bacterium]